MLVSEATWEDYHVVRAQFPNALAWGQAIGAEGEDVRAEVAALEV